MMSKTLARNKNALKESLLVKRLVMQDKAALAEVYDMYSDALFGVVLKIVGDASLAEDVLQEGFLKVWNKIEFYDERRSRFFTWMLNVIRNTAIDKTRTGHFKVQKESVSTTIAESSSYQIQVDHIGLKEVVNRLNPDQKTIIDLMYFGGYSQSEVAKKLELPLGTVKTRSRAAIQKLREILC